VGFRNSFVGEADSFPYNWLLIQRNQVTLAHSYKHKLLSWHGVFASLTSDGLPMLSEKRKYGRMAAIFSAALQTILCII